MLQLCWGTRDRDGTCKASGREINQTEHSLPLGNSVEHTPCIYYWLRPTEQYGEEGLLGSSRSRCAELEIGLWMPDGDVRGGRQFASTAMVCGRVQG